MSALGITMCEPESPGLKKRPQEDVEYIVIPDPHADDVDLSDLRGTKAPNKAHENMMTMKDDAENDELEALAELVPELKSKANKERENHTMTVDVSDKVAADVVEEADEGPIEVTTDAEQKKDIEAKEDESEEDEPVRPAAAPLVRDDSMQVQESAEDDDDKPEVSASAPNDAADPDAPVVAATGDIVVKDVGGNDDQNLGGFDDVASSNAMDSDQGIGDETAAASKPAGETYPNISSGASLSTATQTHEVRMPMYLPTFKPATGCTNASDFIVRCFVARLRSGITVVKHGRSRWCKSRLRILHIHPDGRSISWKPAVGEPASSKRPPKLDLSTCEEVRHAWSADPLNPMFTGTPILRQKCEAANAHKSFALIFPKRTVDITAVTADQCKVLMEGFSALCFRLQVANLAGRGVKKGKERQDEEEVATTTASVTLTNNSTTTPYSPSNPGSKQRN